MKSKGRTFGALTSALAAGTAALTYTAYRKDLKAAIERVETGRQILDTPHGPIEYAVRGDGPPVLSIHGAGGGFDQGLDLARAFLGPGYRVVAPSRFGYLGTPVPADASVEAQADAHLRLLDALKLDRVLVIGISAGGPSALRLCLEHRDRCTALVLAVPMAFAPERPPANAPSPAFLTMLNAIGKSDFLFWAAMRVARGSLIRTLLGTPLDVYRNASDEARHDVDALLESILPISRRAAGIWNDTAIGSTLERYPLEDMHVPTLVLSAADDGYDTYDSGLYTAEQIHDGEFVGFPTGGHLLVGHEEAVRSRIAKFLEKHVHEPAIAV